MTKYGAFNIINRLYSAKVGNKMKKISKILAATVLSATCTLSVGLTACGNGDDGKDIPQKTEVTFDDANALGNANAPTRALVKYSKTVTVEKAPVEAYLYFDVDGEYAIYVDGSNVSYGKKIKTVQVGDTLCNRISVKSKMTVGEHRIDIVTLSGKTAVRAKLYLDDKSYATNSSWVNSTQDIVHETGSLTYYVLGSSVSYGSANNGVSFAEGIAKEFGCAVEKQTVSGTTLRDLSGTVDPSGGKSYVDRLANFNVNSAPDAIIVQLSTNDATQGFGANNSLLGEVDFEEFSLENFNIKTTVGAMEYIIAYAKEYWDCEVIFYTNPKFKNDNYERLVEALADVKEKWDISVVDFYNYKDMSPLTDAQLKAYMSDDIHPNQSGYDWMTEVFCEYLTEKLDLKLLNNLK